MAASEQAGLSERRARLLADARGRVVEVGAGTGLNLAHYPAAVEELVLVEPELPMHERLQKKVAGLTASGRRAPVVQAPAEALPFADDSFDIAVCTLVR